MFFDQQKVTDFEPQTNSLFSILESVEAVWGKTDSSVCSHSIIWRDVRTSLALAVTSDGNIDKLGNSDDWNFGVQDDAEIKIIICSIEKNIKMAQEICFEAPEINMASE